MTDNKEDGVKLFTQSNDTEVKSLESMKFIPDGENTNGMSPISVESVKVPFTGLTKEELMKYANDPFWVRTRWILFVLFWIIWFLMLFGAIFIIIITPKCKEEAPPAWWQRSPLYIVDVAKLSEYNPGSNDNDSVIGILKNRIDHLRDFGVESLVLKNILQTNRNAYEEVTNFTNVNYYLKSTDAFRSEIVEYAKSKGVNLILSFVPNHSGKGEDFIRSAKQDELRDFYVWYPANYTKKPEQPPNNWLSVYNGTAWEWHDGRKQFYLHQFHKEQPDFNFWNPAVLEFFNNVFKFWMNIGISNFLVDKAEYLVEDKYFVNESKGREPGYNMYDYGFYGHYHTIDLPETQEILQNWSETIRNHSGFFGVSGGVLEKTYLADLLMKPIELPEAFNATILNNTIASRRLKVKEKLVCEWRCFGGVDMECFSPTVVDGLMIVGFLLPGTPVLKYGQEFNASTTNIYDAKVFKEISTQKDAKSRLKMIEKLVELRSLPAFVYGEYISTVLNSTIFAFTRMKSGTPGHLIAWNLGKNEITVDFQVLSVIPEDLIVILKSGHSSNSAYAIKSRISSSNVSMPSMAAYVFSFVPKQNK